MVHLKYAYQSFSRWNFIPVFSWQTRFSPDRKHRLMFLPFSTCTGSLSSSIIFHITLSSFFFSITSIHPQPSSSPS